MPAPLKPKLPKKDFVLNDDVEPLKKAICHYACLYLSKNFSDKIFRLILNKIDSGNIDDRFLLNNERIRSNINWNKLNRKQALRLMCRDTQILDLIDLNVYKFSLSELELFLKSHPQYLSNPKYRNLFNFDFTNLTGKEILMLLRLDLNLIYEIEMSNNRFSKIEYSELIREFHTIEEVMNKLNLNDLDNFHIRTLLIYTGERFISELNLALLQVLDWVEILKMRPEMFKYCNIAMFEQSTSSYLKAKIAHYVPIYNSLITKNIEAVDALSWEYLLIYDTEKYIDLCDWSKLTETNWNNILREKPELSKYRKSNVISAINRKS